MSDQAPGDPISGFAIVRRGLYPRSVHDHLVDLEARYRTELAQATADAAAMRWELEEARQREEAVRLTLLAATRTKDELLDAADREVEEMRAVAKEEADRILSEAQYEAFRVVTEARREAEDALTGARRQTSPVVDSPGHGWGSPAAVLAGEQEAHGERTVTEDGHLEDRMDRMRSAVASLERRLQMLTGETLADLAELNEAIRVETEGLEDLAGVVPSADADDRLLDPDRPAPGETASLGAPRGSFYSRRSANLPHIGADAHDALAAMSAVRPPGRHHSQKDMAMNGG